MLIWRVSDILKAKDIPHTLDLWGADVDHDSDVELIILQDSI